MSNVTVVVFKGGAQSGKTTVAKGVKTGAGMTGLKVVHVEFSTPLIRAVNVVMTDRPKRVEQLENDLLRELQATVLPELSFPKRLDKLGDKLDKVLGESRLRPALADWYDVLPKTFEMTEVNKDANRVVLSWLTVVVRALSGNDAILVPPIIDELKRAEALGIFYAGVGGLRFLDEVTALRKIYDKLTVVELQSERVKVDTDEANAKTRSIIADTVYHADFATEAASSRYVRHVFWPDIMNQTVAPEYGPTFLPDQYPS